MRISSLGLVNLLIIAVIFSGAASLMYQVVWTRQLITATSATVFAQSLVLGVFMTGLGLGAFWSGRRAGRVPRPLLGYAVVEGAALACAVVSVPLIQNSAEFRTYLAAIGFSLGTSLWAQLALDIGFLLLPCTLMGASLPFLIEHFERMNSSLSKARRGRFIARLYAFNTLGAVVGCVIAGFGTIEALGLSTTVFIGAFFAAIACTIALFRARGVERAGLETAEDTITGTVPRHLLLGAGIAGFVGLASEILWTRLISLGVLNTVYAFSQVLTMVLIGIGIGSYFSSWATRGELVREALCRRVIAIAAFALLLNAVYMGLVPAAFTEWGVRPDFEAMLAAGLSFEGIVFLGALLIFPSALVAAVLPLVITAATNCRGAAAFGALYGINIVGSVVGSFVTGFLLLHLFGFRNTLLCVQLMSIVGGMILFAANQELRKQQLVVGLVALTSVLLTLSLDIPRQIYERKIGKDVRILDFVEGVESDVMVTEDQRKRRRIWINSSWVAGTGGSPHGMLGSLPALSLSEPQRALGIGLGTGQTFSAVLAHGIRELDCIEINRSVIELSLKWFREANRGLFDRPGVNLYHNDGRAFIRSTSQKYDLIVLEPLQSWTAGTSNLYSKEFYEEAKRVLSPGGVIAQWIPFYGQPVSGTKAMVRAGLEVFPEASLWLSGNDGIAIYHSKSFEISPTELEERLKNRNLVWFTESAGRPLIVPKAVAGNRARHALTADFFSLFLAGPRGLVEWVADTPILDDDHPYLEFEAARHIGLSSHKAIIQSITPHLEPIHEYFLTSSTVSIDNSKVAHQIQKIIFETIVLGRENFDAQLTVLEKGMRKISDSEVLELQYKEQVLRWANGPLKHLPKKQEKLYVRALEHRPKLAEISVNLGVLLAKTKRFDEARKRLRDALENEDVRSTAERVLSLLPGTSTATP